MENYEYIYNVTFTYLVSSKVPWKHLIKWIQYYKFCFNEVLDIFISLEFYLLCMKPHYRKPVNASPMSIRWCKKEGTEESYVSCFALIIYFPPFFERKKMFWRTRHAKGVFLESNTKLLCDARYAGFRKLKLYGMLHFTV